MKKVYVCFSLSATLQGLQEGWIELEQVYAIISRTKIETYVQFCELYSKQYPCINEEFIGLGVWQRVIQPRFYLKDEGIGIVIDNRFMCLDTKMFYDVWSLRDLKDANANVTPIQ